MNKLQRWMMGVVCTVLFAEGMATGFAGEGADGNAPDKDEPGKTIQVLDKFPHIVADRTKKEIRIEAEFSDSARMLEYIILSGQYNEKKKVWQWDRGYESAFLTKARPQHIQLALFFLGVPQGGLEQSVPENVAAGRRVMAQGERVKEDEKKDERPPAGLVEIHVEWKEGDATKSAGIEAFLFDRRKQAVADPIPFAFTGSYSLRVKDRLMLAADQTQAVAAMLFDPSAILNLPYYAGSPYGSAAGFEINPKTVPALFRKDKTIVEGYDKKVIQVTQARPVTLVIKPSSLPVPGAGKAAPAKKE